jgi:hypothetical protein
MLKNWTSQIWPAIIYLTNKFYNLRANENGFSVLSQSVNAEKLSPETAPPDKTLEPLTREAMQQG